jgi:hypothetical protein
MKIRQGALNGPGFPDKVSGFQKLRRAKKGFKNSLIGMLKTAYTPGSGSRIFTFENHPGVSGKNGLLLNRGISMCLSGYIFWAIRAMSSCSRYLNIFPYPSHPISRQTRTGLAPVMAILNPWRWSRVTRSFNTSR